MFYFTVKSMPHRRTAPTLRSLAALAGVSPMTVSLALRNSREVSAATRRRIQQLALERGYQPDPMLTRLMHHLRTRTQARHRANLVGLTSTWSEHRRAVGDYLDRLRAGLAQRAAQLGYTFSLVNLEEFQSPANLQRMLIHRGVEGVVVLPLLRATDLSRALDWSKFSAVATTPSLIAPGLHSVMPNHFDNTLAVCRALTASGFRRIGLAISRDWNERMKYRWSGAIAWHNEFGPAEPVAPLISNLPGPELDPASFHAWLKHEQPDAVITDASVRVTIAGVLAAFPPRSRPSIITMNWPDADCDAGIDQRPERVGAAAIDILAGLLNRGEKGIPDQPNSTMIDGQWIAGRLRSRPGRGAGLRRSRRPAS